MGIATTSHEEFSQKMGGASSHGFLSKPAPQNANPQPKDPNPHRIRRHACLRPLAVRSDASRRAQQWQGVMTDRKPRTLWPMARELVLRASKMAKGGLRAKAFPGPST